MNPDERPQLEGSRSWSGRVEITRRLCCTRPAGQVAVEAAEHYVGTLGAYVLAVASPMPCAAPVARDVGAALVDAGNLMR
jgi:hypothetical protein